ncbi:MAG: alpha/beta hydrolase [Isosphaeraceae bacterium]
MLRRNLAVGFTLALGLPFLLASPNPAAAQDFGKLLERAAKETLREAIAPPGRPRNVPTAPGQPGAPAVPGAPAAPAGVTPSGSGSRLADAVLGTLGGGAQRRSETYPVKTADGWTLVAHRYRPATSPPPGSSPVILCHGLTYSAAFWDLDPSCSFAEYLAGQGFDVWAVSLRGSGLSQKWVWSVDDAPEALIGSALRRSTGGKLGGSTGYASVDPKYANWTMDDHIIHDVPAFVQLVRRQTGAAEVAWVGHSMGGIVALAHLARFQNPGIGKLVTVGSQMTMLDGQLPVQFMRELITTRQREVSGMLRGPELIAQSRTSVHNLFFNVRNVSQPVYDALGTWAMDLPSIGLMQQYLSMSERGELLDARKQYSYTRNLRNVTVPLLVTCGASDQFAPPQVQKEIVDRVGSTDKTLIIFGRAQGYAVDAGHNDALVGLNSRTQVFPVIARWLTGSR